jgi:hypothetical protein
VRRPHGVTRQYGRIETTHRIVTKIDTGKVRETTDTQSMRKDRCGASPRERESSGSEEAGAEMTGANSTSPRRTLRRSSDDTDAR